MWTGLAKTVGTVVLTLGIVALWQGRSLEKIAHADSGVYRCFAIGATADVSAAVERFASSCQAGTLALMPESQHSYGTACCVTK